MRVVTVSKTFPSYHPKAGQHTRFVEMILLSMGVVLSDKSQAIQYFSELNPQLQGLVDKDGCNIVERFVQDHFDIGCVPNKKNHTIRALGKKAYRAGDEISLRVWSGKPYASKQIIIHKTMTIPKVQWFRIDLRGNFELDRVTISQELLKEISANDGFAAFHEDFLHWFRYPNVFYGQLVYFNNEVHYQVEK